MEPVKRLRLILGGDDHIDTLWFAPGYQQDLTVLLFRMRGLSGRSDRHRHLFYRLRSYHVDSADPFDNRDTFTEEIAQVPDEPTDVVVRASVAAFLSEIYSGDFGRDLNGRDVHTMDDVHVVTIGGGVEVLREKLLQFPHVHVQYTARR